MYLHLNPARESIKISLALPLRHDVLRVVSLGSRG